MCECLCVHARVVRVPVGSTGQGAARPPACPAHRRAGWWGGKQASGRFWRHSVALFRLRGSEAEAGLRGGPWEDPRCRDLECSPKVLGAGTGPQLLGERAGLLRLRLQRQGTRSFVGPQVPSCSLAPSGLPEPPFPNPGPAPHGRLLPGGRQAEGRQAQPRARCASRRLLSSRTRGPALKGGGLASTATGAQSPSVPVFKWQGATRGL